MTPNIVVVGAGAIGSTLVGWLFPHYTNIYLLARGEGARVIKEQGLRLYPKEKSDEIVTFKVNVIESLTEIANPEILIIAVKNYDLDATSRELRAQLGSAEPIVVGIQNGAKNQSILPQYFTKVLYGVISFNAWRDAPGVIGHDPTGYIVLGTPTNDHVEELKLVSQLLNLGLHCSITDRLQDAVHTKLIINQANALMTIVGFQQRPIKSFKILIKLTLSLFLECIQLVQAAGFHEYRIGKLPSWKFVQFGAKMPAGLATVFYKMNSKKVGLNSMSQDVFGGRTNTEIESLTGYMIELAHRTNFPAPINETIYEIAKERFGPNFKPISEIDLWEKVQQRIHSTKNK